MAKSNFSLVWPFAGGPKADQTQRTDKGWDLQNTANNGSNPVFAAAAGTVITGGKDPHGFGDFYPVVDFDKPQKLGDGSTAVGIYYGHVVATVPNNTKVAQGAQIANTTNPGQGDNVPSGWLEIGYWGVNGPMGNGGQMKTDLTGADVPAGADAGLAGLGTGAGTDAGNATTDSGNSSAAADATGANLAAITASAGTDLPDPRSNLPFSPEFWGLALNGTGTGGFAQGQKVFPVSAKLVRGGMQEIIGSRPGGFFQAFFMINPDSIAVSVNINGDLPPPEDLTQNINSNQFYATTAQSISFTLQFNRMYEVWYGNQPGPSEEGCRWDIRAIERLLGLYDSTGSTIGLAANETGVSAAMGLPVQVVFGGQNSMQFQGRITGLDYTYTRFDVNMIPIEATADITVMRIYNPPGGADLVSPRLPQDPTVSTTQLQRSPFSTAPAIPQTNLDALAPRGLGV